MSTDNASRSGANRAAPLIELACVKGRGWHAVFYGGAMPQGIAIPLPFSSAARIEEVGADLLARFPGAKIEEFGR